MNGKDNRSKDNRKNMKQHKHYHKQQQQQSHRGCNTSSSSPRTTVRSIVDVADSSDEPRYARKGWSSGTRSVAPQKNRDILDTLPPTDTDDGELMNGTINENARAQLRAGDYKQMSQFPNMGGGHFIFGSEKEWNSIVEGHTQLHSNATSKYFTLNISLLNCGLQTIPFYKRMDYSTNMFTRQQITAQNEAAERAERIYQERVLNENNGQFAGAKSASKSNAPSATSAKESQLTASCYPKAPDELDELLTLADTKVPETPNSTGQTVPVATSPVVQPPTPTTASKNDVEQWLDSVLNE